MTTATATAASAPAPATPDLAAVKTRQQAAWASGDYAVVGTTLQIVGETLCEAVDLRAGQTRARRRGRQRQRDARGRAPLVRGRLDRLCGALLERGRERAEAERLNVDVPGGRCRGAAVRRRSFDVVLSTFGVMFTPNQEQAAAELLRVCRPGGKIGLANWTPEGFIGQLFKTIGKYVPPPAGVKSPALWGTERGSTSCSARHRRIDGQARISCSAIARRSTGWRCSAPTTGRC